MLKTKTMTRNLRDSPGIGRVAFWSQWRLMEITLAWSLGSAGCKSDAVRRRLFSVWHMLMTFSLNLVERHGPPQSARLGAWSQRREVQCGLSSRLLDVDFTVAKYCKSVNIPESQNRRCFGDVKIADHPLADPTSKAGHLITVTTDQMAEGQMAPWSLLGWRSYKMKRVVSSALDMQSGLPHIWQRCQIPTLRRINGRKRHIAFCCNVCLMQNHSVVIWIACVLHRVSTTKGVVSI